MYFCMCVCIHACKYLCMYMFVGATDAESGTSTEAEMLLYLDKIRQTNRELVRYRYDICHFDYFTASAQLIYTYTVKVVATFSLSQAQGPLASTPARSRADNRAGKQLAAMKTTRKIMTLVLELLAYNKKALQADQDQFQKLLEMCSEFS